MSVLSLQLVSPDEEHFVGNIEMVVLPGEEGDFTVLVDHAPIITYLRPGGITILTEEGKELSYFVASGFVKVESNKCKVLVDYVNKKSDLDVQVIREQIASYYSKIENEKDEIFLERLRNEITVMEEKINFFESQS